MSGDRGNELADIRARAEAWLHDGKAREALSRVSRSEPAPPNDVCSWCDMHGVCDPGNCPMRPAPPVPEEQQ